MAVRHIKMQVVLSNEVVDDLENPEKTNFINKQDCYILSTMHSSLKHNDLSIIQRFED